MHTNATNTNTATRSEQLLQTLQALHTQTQTQTQAAAQSCGGGGGAILAIWSSNFEQQPPPLTYGRQSSKSNAVSKCGALLRRAPLARSLELGDDCDDDDDVCCDNDYELNGGSKAIACKQEHSKPIKRSARPTLTCTSRRLRLRLRRSRPNVSVRLRLVRDEQRN